MLAASETNAGNGSSVSTVSYLSVNSRCDTSNVVGFCQMFERLVFVMQM